ncbi:MAG: response regulator [Silvanigrellaceae bacterium]|nr:response regulator [Silvanigrellaceae bacterium]
MAKNILIVDDSKTIRQHVGLTLTNQGFGVVEAEDGLVALSQLEKHENIEMIISDVNMPRMDGLEMIEKIRQNSRFKFIPIIMLTTESSGDKVKRAKLAGASGWLLKPFNSEQLLSAVKRLVRQ